MAMRCVLAESFKWACQRIAFKKPLITQPVIRQKFARMAAALEAVHSYLEYVTYQMDMRRLSTWRGVCRVLLCSGLFRAV